MELLYEISISVELPITIIFWVVLLPILLRSDKTTGTFLLYAVEDILINANLHAGPIICLLIELPYNKYPFPKRHTAVIAFLNVIYLVINVGTPWCIQPTVWRCGLSTLPSTGSPSRHTSWACSL